MEHVHQLGHGAGLETDLHLLALLGNRVEHRHLDRVGEEEHGQEEVGETDRHLSLDDPEVTVSRAEGAGELRGPDVKERRDLRNEADQKISIEIGVDGGVHPRDDLREDTPSVSLVSASESLEKGVAGALHHVASVHVGIHYCVSV